MKAERFFRLALALLASAGLLLQAACMASGLLRAQLWGVHLLAFLPLPLGILVWLVTAGAVVWLVAPQRGQQLESLVASASRWAARPGASLALAAAGGVLFWLLRSRQTVLGDASQLLTDLPHGLRFHPRQPLGMYVEHLLYAGTSRFASANAGDSSDVALRAVALGSVLGGVLFVLAAWSLGRVLVRAADAGAGAAAAGTRSARAAKRAPARDAAKDAGRMRTAAPGLRPAGIDAASSLLVTLVLLSQGYALLFFGYIESYTFYALMVALYLLASLLHLRGALPIAAPLAVLLVTIAVHLSALVLLPTAALLVAVALARPHARRAVLRDVGIMILAALLLDRILASIPGGSSLWNGIAGMLRTATANQGGGAGASYMFSAAHLRDFLDEQYLLGPLAGLFCVPALLFAWRHGALRSAPAAFLALGAACVLAGSWCTSDPALGFARDWDIFTPVGVVLTASGLFALLATVQSGARTRLLGFCIAFSALHLGTWVLVNHSEARSMSRFAVLPLGHGRAEVVIGNWHLRHGRDDEARVWFEKALQREPHNGTAYAFLGFIAAQRGDVNAAADAYAHAVRERPDKAEHRQNLVHALELLGRDAEAVPHYEVLCRTEPQNADNWLGWARTLRKLGREEAARQMLQRALPSFEARLRRQPEGFQARIDLGALLAGLQRYDEALQLFQRALGTEPDSDTALYNVACMLMALNRGQEARGHLQHLLQVAPEYAQNDEVRAWLAQLELR